MAIGSPKFWVVCLLLVALLIALACATGPSPSPSSSITPTSSASPSASSKPTSAAQPTSSSAAKPTQAASPVSFSGKTITLVVAYAPGGGGDIGGRLYAKYLSKFLPGNPSVIVRNMPGASGITGANFAFGAKPDGQTILYTASGNILAQVLGMSGVRYNLQDMRAIMGFMAGGTFYMKSGLINKLEDLPTAKGIVVGAVSGGVGWIIASIIELLGLRPDKVALAYGGSGDARRAFLSGEINCGGDNTQGYLSGIAPYVTKGEVMPILQFGVPDSAGAFVREPALPDIPTAGEAYSKIYGKAPSGMPWEGFKALVSLRSYAGVLQLPPGTPDSIVRAYWDASQKMSKDSAFEADATLTQGNFLVNYGEAYEKAFHANIRMDTKTMEWVRDMLSTKYGVVMQ
ncbi:MAG: hypothetical protein HYX90_02755 [Chloroflexi bacterium]|nr:hypothetical protein [Chloroflexota bacterium]